MGNNIRCFPDLFIYIRINIVLDVPIGGDKMKLPSQKVIDIVLAIIFIIFVGIIIYYFGNKVAAVLSGLLMFLGLRKTPQDKIDDANDNIEKAGDEIEKPDGNTPESALDKFDDFFDERDSSNK